MPAPGPGATILHAAAFPPRAQERPNRADMAWPQCGDPIKQGRPVKVSHHRDPKTGTAGGDAVVG